MSSRPPPTEGMGGIFANLPKEEPTTPNHPKVTTTPEKSSESNDHLAFYTLPEEVDEDTIWSIPNAQLKVLFKETGIDLEPEVARQLVGLAVEQLRALVKNPKSTSVRSMEKTLVEISGNPDNLFKLALFLSRSVARYGRQVALPLLRAAKNQNCTQNHIQYVYYSTLLHHPFPGYSDSDIALDELVQLAKREYGPAMFIVARVFLTYRRNIKIAVGLLQKLADREDPKGCQFLGDLYRTGEHVPQDIQRAFTLYQLAYQKDDPYAAFHLGNMYSSGIITPDRQPDHKQAHDYYVRAASAGIAEAQHNLGAMYLTGQGVLKNETMAFEYFKMASVLGMPLAMINLGKMYLEGTGTECDLQAASAWLQKALQINPGLKPQVSKLMETLEEKKTKAASKWSIFSWRS
ncbi:hypothetical protein IWQ62_006404 [Dispira parvispora]|uniref:Uncharacterized protein n=1 Tax=Dispira parvispora TaxID=1520584 RepID=A0A9W8AGR1_9FUNG|nr:hypothetical protein IWQ62_006404 [Dispira parvispora]